MTRPLVLVVAAARNGVIGAEGALPWRIPTDLKRFKALTLGKPMLMGRRTYDSIGRPLPGRETVVLTRDPAFRPAGVHAVGSLDEGIARADALAAAMGAGEIAIVGGARVYAEALPRAARIELTRVAAEPAGDALFPDLDPAAWAEVAREAPPRAPADEHAVAFLTYARRRAG